MLKKVLMRLTAITVCMLLMNTSNVRACMPSGDINHDGVLNAIDAAEVLILLAQLGVDDDPENPLLVRGEEYDLNQDGQVTAVDAAIMLQWAAEDAAYGR